MEIFDGLARFTAAVGTRLGASDWHTVTQEQVDLFAAATDDHQWIHVDPERAAAGPFGGTIAHGFLTLAMLTSLVQRIYRVEGLSMSINYGFNRIRFPAPVPVGSRIRADVELLAVEPGPKGAQATSRITVEIEGVDRPACIAEWVTLLVP